LAPESFLAYAEIWSVIIRWSLVGTGMAETVPLKNIAGPLPGTGRPVVLVREFERGVHGVKVVILY